MYALLTVTLLSGARPLGICSWYRYVARHNKGSCIKRGHVQQCTKKTARIHMYVPRVTIRHLQYSAVSLAFNLQYSTQLGAGPAGPGVGLPPRARAAQNKRINRARGANVPWHRRKVRSPFSTSQHAVLLTG